MGFRGREDSASWLCPDRFPGELAVEMDWKGGWVSTQGVQAEAAWGAWA